MGKTYMTSKYSDLASRDTNASNLVRSLLIMIGIYDSFKRTLPQQNDYSSFGIFYTSALEKMRSEYHFLNLGAKVLSNQMELKQEKTTGRRIKRLSYTKRAKVVKIPWNSDAIIGSLFDYIKRDDILKKFFTDVILNQCDYCRGGAGFNLSNCSQKVLGFVFVFLQNVLDPDFSYTQKYKDKAEHIQETIYYALGQFSLKDDCKRRKAAI